MSNGPVVPAAEARLACRPGPELSGRLTDGFWLRRQLCNREVTIPHGMRMLEETGTLENFRASRHGCGLSAGNACSLMW